MGYAYDHDCPFEAFITNLGKYNEGVLVGEWVKFPTTAEELQKVFERIGIGSKDDFGHPYEEWFITDYRIMNDATWERAMHCQIFRNSVEPVFFVTFQSDITEFKIHKIKIITTTDIDKIESIMYNTDIHKKATKY